MAASPRRCARRTSRCCRPVPSPGIADIVLDPSDPTGNRVFVTDASEGFPPAGRVLAIDIAAASLSVVQSGLGYAAGLAAARTRCSSAT